MPAHLRVLDDRGRCHAKALSTFMGHANITLDRYGHPMPGSEAEAADLLDAYLAEQRRRRAA